MEKIIPIRFRWPVIQHSPTEVEMKITLDPKAPPLVRVNDEALEKLHCSNKEYDEAVDAATDAVIRAIMIVK